MRVYADAELTPCVVSTTPVPLDMFPRLDREGASLNVNAVCSGLRVHRVFACSTADPALCR
jgi:hypothetical protein